MSDMTAIAHPLVHPRPPRRATLWLAGAALWTLLGLLSALQAAVYSTYTGNPLPLRELVPMRLADWYTCAIFTPLFFWLVRSRRAVVVQCAAVLAAVPLKFALYAAVMRLDFGGILARSFGTEVIALSAVLAIVHGIEYYRRLRERELHAARLETELASARLEALEAQLQPHFLFNTLHGISTLMRRDVDSAEEMLTHLSDLLRRTLRPRDGHEVALSDELELLQHYLDIMKIRFADRLTVRVDADAGVLRALVPHLVLQPLVENALQHGIARKPGNGLVEVRARREGESLEITVRDDGEGHRGGGERIGLSNTRRRLRELYGDAQSLILAPAEDGGLRVALRIPFRTA